MRNATFILLALLAGCAARTKNAEPAPPSQTNEAAAPAVVADVGTPDTAPPPAGSALYGQVCITCHGPLGDGKGLGQQLFSFGSPADQWKNGPTKEGIILTMTLGVHETSMQAFPNFRDVEREAIAEYVLTLRAALVAQPK